MLRPTIVLVASLVILSGRASAQFKTGPSRPQGPAVQPQPRTQIPQPQPIMPKPVQQPPQITRPVQQPMPVMQMKQVWKCNKCGGDLGSGPTPAAVCPRCNSRIINSGQPGGAPAPVAGNFAAAPTRSSSSSIGIVIGVVFAVLVLFGGLGTAAFLVLRKPEPVKKPKKKKRIIRDDDD